ncbi:MAG: hypothetical protein HYY93_11920 [Planctomycetes bacterium]|nr:hypothetical protein [Planctomycetota bacterium]
MPDPASPVLTDSLARTLKRLFFASGATGLIYETIFVKVFGYTFGTTAYATATVLAAFMGGLALGSYAVGRMATRSKRPILLYATLELATGLYCLFTPFWHRLVTDGYVRLHESLQPDGATLTAIRFALAFLVVLIPSTLMGGTLPAILKSALTRKAGLSGQIGSFYAANLGGAATGTLVSTFLLLPTGGLYGALAVAVLVNVAIFAVCVRLSRGVAVEAPGEPVESGGGGPADAPRGRLPYAAVLGIAAFSGLSSLAYENIFSHVFGTLIGSSAFAFGTMLFTFLLGLAFGGRLSAGFARRGKAPEALAASLLAPPVLLAAGVPFYDRIDSLYGLVGLTAPSFLVMEGCRFLVCVAVMLAPATLFGMVFPLCMEMAGGRMQDTPRRIGAIYAVNTLASVVGSLLAGFVMIGRLGSQDSFRVLGAAGLVVGLAVLFRLLADRRRRLVWGGGAAAGFLLATGLLPAWNIGRITGGSWVYFTHDHSRAEVIHFEEDVHGGMTTVTQEGKVRTMWTNGKFQGNNATEMSVQRGFAVYPVLLQNRFERALNIGFGTGVTAATLGRFPFKKIEIAEIAPSIVRASRFFRCRASGSRGRPISSTRSSTNSVTAGSRPAGCSSNGSSSTISTPSTFS